MIKKLGKKSRFHLELKKCRTSRSLKADFVRHFFDFSRVKNYLFKKGRCSTNFSQNFIRIYGQMAIFIDASRP